MRIRGVPFEGPLRRGDVVRVAFDPVRGSEQGGVRPALVISPDLINRNSPVILVAGITTKKVDRIYPFEVPMGNEAGLAEPSKAMLMQLRSVDRSRIAGRYGRIADSTHAALDEALRIATGLTPL